MNKDDEKLYNRKSRRTANFFPPSDKLKSKVGSGGLDDLVLSRAQTVIEENHTDFRDIANPYIEALKEAVAFAKANKGTSTDEQENIINAMLFPAMQLKANGGLFKFPIVTNIGHRFVQFLEVVETLNDDALHIVEAFLNAVSHALANNMMGESALDTAEAKALMVELSQACERFFEKYPDNTNPNL